MPPLPQPTFFHQAIIIKNELIIFGGNDEIQVNFSGAISIDVLEFQMENLCERTTKTLTKFSFETLEWTEVSFKSLSDTDPHCWFIWIERSADILYIGAGSTLTAKGYFYYSIDKNLTSVTKCNGVSIFSSYSGIWNIGYLLFSFGCA